jgi:hypothetical protein
MPTYIKIIQIAGCSQGWKGRFDGVIANGINTMRD